MINILQYIYEAFLFIINFITGTVNNITSLLFITSQSVTNVLSLMGVFNGFIGISITMVALIAFIKLLLGWGNT